MVIKEDVVDTSIFEEAYYEDPELQIKRGVEKLYGELPILKSSSNDFYSIHPHRIGFFYEKIGNFLDWIKELPNSVGYQHRTEASRMDKIFWRQNTLNFIQHLESVWMISGPVTGFIQSKRAERVETDQELSIIDEPIVYVCNIPFIHRKRIEIFQTSLLDYLFTYKNDGEIVTSEEMDKYSSDNEKVVVCSDWSGNVIIWPNIRRNSEDVELPNGSSTISWVLFEKILSFLDDHGIITEFNENSELVKALSDHIWITKEEYLLYRLEYFLLNVWHLNEPCFWWRIFSFFESHYSGKTRFLDAFRRLLLLELPPANPWANVDNSPAVSSNVKKLVFGDIVFQLGEKWCVRIGKSEPINAKDKEFIKMIKYDGNKWALTPIPVKFDSYDLKRWIKTLYAMIKYGKDYQWIEDVKVYTDGPKSFAWNVSELAEAIPKFINHTDLEDIRIGDLVSLANRALDRFDSSITMRSGDMLTPVTGLKMKDGTEAPVLGKRIPKSE